MGIRKMPDDFYKIQYGAITSTMSHEASDRERGVLGDPAASLVVRIPIDLSFDLSPNARVGWRRKHAVTKATRWAAKAYALETVMGAAPTGDLDDWLAVTRFRLDATIYWAKGRKRVDDDNGWTMLKPIRDGLADAIGRNDKDFTTGALTQERDPDGLGYMTIALTEE